MTNSPNGPTDDQLFYALVTDLATQAWVAMGKIKHPVTDQIERNIPAASLIIDMLDMLNRKTVGNRSNAEDNLLLDTLKNLKLNFVAEANIPEESEETHREPDEQAEAADAQVGPETTEEKEAQKKSATTSKPRSGGKKKSSATGTPKKKPTKAGKT